MGLVCLEGDDIPQYRAQQGVGDPAVCLHELLVSLDPRATYPQLRHNEVTSGPAQSSPGHLQREYHHTFPRSHLTSVMVQDRAA